jgi:tetratricopeptide (TPR) repeat protein
MAVIFSLFFIYQAFPQQERKLIREGVKEYEKQKFSDAEISFRKALDENQKSFPADYNIGNSLYKQNKFKEAAGQYESLQDKEPGKKELADIYHNIGNSYFEQQQYDKSIEAYKNSLKLRPADEDTRYNLAYSLLKLKQQQQQQQNQQNNQNDKNDQQDKNGDQQKDQDQKKDQQKDQDQNNENQNEQDQQPKNDMTKQEAEQILQAIQNQEKQVQEKVDLKKAKSARANNQKDW